VPPPSSTPEPTPADGGVPFGEAVRAWVKVAVHSFGGPAGQIAVMHRVLVEEKRWIGEARFLHALNYCMLLPGPEAQQLATYVGWLLHRVKGGLVAGGLFILPGFLSILALSLLYAGFQETTAVQALFYGLKPAVLAVVAVAVVRIGRRALRTPVMVALAALAFVAIFFLAVPFPWIIGAAALVGFLGARLRPAAFPDPAADAGPVGGEGEGDPDRETRGSGAGREREAGASAAREAAAPRPRVADALAAEIRPSLGRTARAAAVWLAVWLAPLALLRALLGPEDVFVREGLFFSKVAVVTFGGAYAVLAYVAQQAVDVFGWLAPGEMLDGLGMAETTPGPLIQVVQFVGFMGAYRHAEGLDPMLAGVLGSLVAAWATFAPCFLWIFAGAPWVETLRGKRSLATALSAITAAVVGVILNLAVWFGLNTVFAEVGIRVWHGVRLYVPAWSTLDPAAFVIAALAFVTLVRWKRGMIETLAASAAAGALYSLATAG